MIELPRKLASVCLLAAITLSPFLQVSLNAQMSSLGGIAASGKSQGAGVAPRVVEKINESHMMSLAGHVRPFLKKAVDRGQVDGSQQLGAIMLMLSRTPQQQAALDSYVDQLHNRNSPNFHNWLTPAEFGARYQPADEDVAAVRAWLVSKGLTVLDVVPSKTYISFTGTVGQLRSIFKADIHHVSINGEEHMATVNEPQIPAALAPVIGGLHKLDDFSPKPLVKNFGTFTKDLKSGKVTSVAGTTTGPTANLTDAEGGHQMAPLDFYTIYNENPLLRGGITGAGQTIAVIEEVQVAPADVTAFRSVFGLPTYPATPNATAGGVNYMIGSTSGLGGYASCFSPVTQAAGKTSGEEGEADLDLQWSGAVAPNATVDFVACGGTATSGTGGTIGSLGIDHSAQYIANFLSGSVVAASMSYGECEADMTGSTTTGVGYYNNQWQQFAAEGITPIVSSGDGGAEQCYQNDANATTLPPSVNGFGSSAYNVSAGGTDFGDVYESNNYKTTPVSTWWNATNGPGLSSAATYVPETTWSGYCSNPLYVSYLQNSGSTTFGTTYTPSAVCSNATALARGYVAVVGGAGGISTFNTIPTWQSVYGVGANSVSKTQRNLPDVSLFAASGFWGHYMPYCETDVANCTVADYQAETASGAGGTSFVAPQLAGLMALISQKTNQRQGQANYTFYNLAAQEYGAAGSPSSTLSACSGSKVVPGQRPPDSCYFYDVSNDMPSLQGGTITPGIYQPCLVGDIDCYQGAGTKYGVNTVPGTVATAGILGYTASPGYDDATGLGSLNINSVVQGWNNASPTFASTSTLATSSNSILTTGSVTLTATVTATGRGGNVAPGGIVEFFVGSTSGKNLGSGPITTACSGTGAATSCKGVASLVVAGSALPVGSDSIVAYFAGDGANDAPSTSSAQTVQVTAPVLASTTTLATTPASPVVAGTAVTLTATVAVGSAPVTAGTVNFYDTVTTSTLLASTELTVAGAATFTFTPGAGSHSFQAQFPGTTSVPASNSAQSTFVVTPAATYQTSSILTYATTGSNYGLTDTVTFFGLSTPSGQVNFNNNGTNTAGTLTSLTPTMAQPTTIVTGATNTSSLFSAIGDFNKDGIADLAVTNFGDGTVNVLLGKAGSTLSYQAPVAYATGKAPYGIVVGDFNNDGKADLAVSNVVSGTVSILLGNGNGTFQTQHSYNTGSTGTAGATTLPEPYGLAIADFNKDGFQDLVTTNTQEGTISILLGHGDGSFGAPSTTAVGVNPFLSVAADFNGDGNPDLMVVNSKSNNVSYLLGDGSGSFNASTATTYATGGTPYSAAVGDFNQDGRPDVAISNLGDPNAAPTTGSVTILLNQAGGGFATTSYATGVEPTSVVVMDFNGDGKQDLAVANYASNTVGVLTGKGDGTFNTQITFPSVSTPYQLAIGDLNGDGKPDVAVTSFGGANLGVQLGTQTGVYSLSGLTAGATQHQVTATYTPSANDAYMATTSNPVQVPADATPITKVPVTRKGAVK
ncbi:FG-GAP-like repeat-containing protein [Granulicella arctica]|uniref:FG-GAP-like repeat-containing protein n=1 Tax=Granulicella arctica TaxID=940613 RepID=UPI0021E0859A|nr:FG-GAP-like repeat-containing protein [Granulicella arctica]